MIGIQGVSVRVYMGDTISPAVRAGLITGD